MTTPLIMGNIGAPYGVQGWVKINSFTNPQENLFSYPWLLERAGKWLPVKLEMFRAHSGGFVAKLVDVADRDQAALLTNCKIGVERDHLPELDADEEEFYWNDILGLRVFNQDNIDLGNVVDIFATGANDVLVIRGENGEHLIPLVFTEFVVKIDLAAQRMDVHWDPEF